MTENIHTAIHAIMEEVGFVQKEKNANLNYSFAGEAALIRAIRPSMLKHNVIMFVADIRNATREQFVTKSGTPMMNTRLEAVVRFLHAPSGTFVDVVTGGEGADAGDKSQNKALTGAYKYAIRQTFCIETGDDPDANASTEQERETHHDRIMARWKELWGEADKLGIKAEPLAPRMTDDEIAERGKELAALVNEAKAKAK